MSDFDKLFTKWSFRKKAWRWRKRTWHGAIAKVAMGNTTIYFVSHFTGTK